MNLDSPLSIFEILEHENHQDEQRTRIYRAWPDFCLNFHVDFL